MEYIKYLKAKAVVATSTKADKPVLSEEDEQFLNRITSQDNPPPLEIRDAQIALMDGAQNIPLPETPDETVTEPVFPPEPSSPKEKTSPIKKSWSWLRRDSREARTEKRAATAAGLDDIAARLRKAELEDTDEEKEAKREEEDMTVVLERLNLAAVNNRVFSISDETQELIQKFNVVFKDLINGVPTAYDDLESLLTNGDRQLQNTFNSLPAFLQKLIERLPETMTKGFAPEMMAAASERAQKSGVNMENAGKAAAAASKMGFKTPSLKELVGKPAAITGMLRSIISYLRARFPAFMGMNVLWSLALFVLLFVLWYCHKRGKEVRLDKERQLTEDEVARLDEAYKKEHPGETFMTTAEEGASIEEVQAGINEVEAVKTAAQQAALSKDQPTNTTIVPPPTVPK
ncbi:hypothetical protein B0A52_08674 [Exophiala mesophila]|uniref:Uncharacterized protein n=1 Tax=Exophiala mesophila TaxID=212818 RepID=A0A438MWP0_EXOME|nr:hypothetical protein B0A52_08674 [Exophiala mesophila]